MNLFGNPASSNQFRGIHKTPALLNYMEMVEKLLQTKTVKMNETWDLNEKQCFLTVRCPSKSEKKRYKAA